MITTRSISAKSVQIIDLRRIPEYQSPRESHTKRIKTSALKTSDMESPRSYDNSLPVELPEVSTGYETCKAGGSSPDQKPAVSTSFYFYSSEGDAPIAIPKSLQAVGYSCDTFFQEALKARSFQGDGLTGSDMTAVLVTWTGAVRTLLVPWGDEDSFSKMMWRVWQELPEEVEVRCMTKPSALGC